MKKFLAVVAVVLMLATSAFAVSLTKEEAKGGLPGVLYNEASLSSVGVFPSLVGDIANVAMLDYLGQPIGTLVVKSDLGVLGLVISPSMDYSLDGISVLDIVSDVATVMYGTSMDKMKIGAALTLGVDSEAQKDLDTDDLSVYTNENETVMILGVRGGVSIEGMDLALGLNMWNESNLSTVEDVSEATVADSVMDIDLAARMNLAGWNLVAGVGYVMGSEKHVTKDLVLDTETTWTATNSKIDVSALAGNTIKASETLSVTVGTGLIWTAYSTDAETVSDNGTTETLAGGMESSADLELPLWVAVEGKLNETWTVLGGTHCSLLVYNGDGYKYDDNIASDEQDLKPLYEKSDLWVEPDLSFAVGLEGKIGDLTLDMNLEPGILLAGPNFISGQTTFWMNSSIALCYMWK